MSILMMFHVRRHTLPVVCMLVGLLAGCRQSESSPAAAPSVDVNQSEAIARTSDPNGSATSQSTTGQSTITESEADAFAMQIEQCVLDNDPASYSELVDLDSIVRRSIEGFDVSDEFKNGFMQGASPVKLSTNFIGALHQMTIDAGSYQYVRSVRRGDSDHLVFRLVQADGGLNYHDYRVVRRGNQLIADDLFFALSGETYTDTMKKLVTGTFNAQASMVSKFTGSQKRELEDLNKLGEMTKAVNQGDKKRALAIYETLPAAKQNETVPLLYRVMATDVDDDAAYLAALNACLESSNGGIAAGLLMIDAAVVREDSDMLIESHRQIERWTGGDIHIDLLIASVLADWGQIDKAIEMSADADPSILGDPLAHEQKLSIAAMGGQNQIVLEQLRALRELYGYEFEDLTTLELYDTFVKSPEYQAWLND